MHINWGDVVAGYAAVVSTAALGWQGRQWNMERKGKLDLRLHNWWPPGIDAYVEGQIFNNNDYPVRLDWLTVEVSPPESPSIEKGLTPEQAGLPGEVPAHDDVIFTLNAKSQPPWPPVPRRSIVTVMVGTSQSRCSSVVRIRDAKPWHLRTPMNQILMAMKESQDTSLTAAETSEDSGQQDRDGAQAGSPDATITSIEDRGS